MNKDPRRMQARFTSKCAACGATIKKGESIAWWPIGRRVECAPCGEAGLQRYQEEVADERAYEMSYGY